MDINPQVVEILKEFNVPKDSGLLCLLGIYYGLDIDSIVPEEYVKAINITKIVEKDYTSNTIVWNIPLFTGVEVAFDWVKDWIEGFGRINPERRGSYRDAITRMKDFFKKNPEYRKDDVYKARDLYFSGLSSSKYCMHSHKFIYDGAGVMRKSTLLGYCEKVVNNDSNTQQKGKVIN